MAMLRSLGVERVGDQEVDGAALTPVQHETRRLIGHVVRSLASRGSIYPSFYPSEQHVHSSLG